MKKKLRLIQTVRSCAALLALDAILVSITEANETPDRAKEAAPKAAGSIPCSEIGAKAGADYQGDGLSVMAAATGAQLRCVFQKIEGEVTREGLWLTSTVEESKRERFRVVARAIGRAASEGVTKPHNPLPRTGTVEVIGNVARFVRPGLTEEYSVSMDGVRQDTVWLAALTVTSAQNVRAHYANGQVWVVWDTQDAVVTTCVPTLTPVLSNGVPTTISNCLPATYAIYWSENSVTNNQDSFLRRLGSGFLALPHR